MATQTEYGNIQALAVKKTKQPRCPYCVLGSGFRPMKVLSNGRQICEKCGHIVFPNDTEFRCPCPRREFVASNSPLAAMVTTVRSLPPQFPLCVPSDKLSCLP